MVMATSFPHCIFGLWFCLIIQLELIIAICDTELASLTTMYLIISPTLIVYGGFYVRGSTTTR